MDALLAKIREFNRQRDWEQYHSPKNLAMALAVETAELVEHFQWLSQAESRNLPAEKLEAVKEEIADILIYLLNLADKTGVDVLAAAQAKLAKNEIRYPAPMVRGKSAKYDQYE